MAIRNTSCAGRRNKDRREASGDAEVYPERKFKGTRYDAGRENLEIVSSEEIESDSQTTYSAVRVDGEGQSYSSVG